MEKQKIIETINAIKDKEIADLNENLKLTKNDLKV